MASYWDAQLTALIQLTGEVKGAIADIVFNLNLNLQFKLWDFSFEKKLLKLNILTPGPFLEPSKLFERERK